LRAGRGLIKARTTITLRQKGQLLRAAGSKVDTNDYDRLSYVLLAPLDRFINILEEQIDKISG
jgi:hypothetical protein